MVLDESGDHLVSLLPREPPSNHVYGFSGIPGKDDSPIFAADQLSYFSVCLPIPLLRQHRRAIDSPAHIGSVMAVVI